MGPKCDRSHVSTCQRDVINYAKALRRTMAKDSSTLDNIGAALKRLRLAVDRLDAEERRERARTGG